MTQVDRYPAGANTPDPCQTVYYNYDTNTLTYFNQFDGAINGWGRLTGAYWNGLDNAGNVHGQCGYGFGEEYNYTYLGQVRVKRTLVTSPGNNWILADGEYNYDGAARLTSFQPPGINTLGQTLPFYTYDRDALGRESDMYSGTIQNPTWLVTNASVTYNAAGQLKTWAFGGISQTHTYNVNNQLTGITATSGGSTMVNLSYSFGSANNGRVSTETDNLSGEMVTYIYDALNRLTGAAVGGGWSTGFNYDGFGNLFQQSGQGGAPSMSVTVNPQTNRIANVYHSEPP